MNLSQSMDQNSWTNRKNDRERMNTAKLMRFQAHSASNLSFFCYCEGVKKRTLRNIHKNVHIDSKYPVLWNIMLEHWTIFVISLYEYRLDPECRDHCANISPELCTSNNFIIHSTAEHFSWVKCCSISVSIPIKIHRLCSWNFSPTKNANELIHIHILFQLWAIEHNILQYRVTALLFFNPPIQIPHHSHTHIADLSTK